MSDNSKDYSHLLTTTQAGERSGKHTRTIVEWIRSGKLPALKMHGGRGRYLIEPEDLEKLLEILSTPVPYDPKEKS